MKSAKYACTAAALAAALVFSAGTLPAQDQSTATTPPPQTGPGMHGEHHRMSAEQQLDHMSKRLNLTDAQKQQILPLLQTRDQQMDTLISDTSMSRQDKRGKMMNINKSTHEQIRNVLTDQQKQQLDGMMQEHGRGPGAMGGNPPAGEQPQPPPPAPQN